MSKFDKLLVRFLGKPRDFTYSELTRLLNGFGYVEQQGAGSRVAFYNERIIHKIKLHKPHPGHILKAYQIELILEELKEREMI